MNWPRVLGAMAIAVGPAFGIGTIAQTLPETHATASTETKKKDADARRNADAAKREADYAAAKEKCNVFTGDVKINCVNNAKARFDRQYESDEGAFRPR